MKQDQRAQRMREHLEALCVDEAPAGLDLGCWQSRVLAVSTAIGFAAALGACYGAPKAMPADGPESAGDSPDGSRDGMLAPR